MAKDECLKFLKEHPGEWASKQVSEAIGTCLDTTRNNLVALVRESDYYKVTRRELRFNSPTGKSGVTYTHTGVRLRNEDCAMEEAEGK